MTGGRAGRGSRSTARPKTSAIRTDRHVDVKHDLHVDVLHSRRRRSGRRRGRDEDGGPDDDGALELFPPGRPRAPAPARSDAAAPEHALQHPEDDDEPDVAGDGPGQTDGGRGQPESATPIRRRRGRTGHRLAMVISVNAARAGRRLCDPLDPRTERRGRRAWIAGLARRPIERPGRPSNHAQRHSQQGQARAARSAATR